MTRQPLFFLTLLFIVTSCQPTRNMVAVIKTDGKYGFINYKGKVIIPATFDYARDFQEGLAPIEINGKTGYMNIKGQLVIPATFDEGTWFSEEFAAVKQNNKWGYINKSGQTVIPFQFEDADEFSDGLATISKDKTCAYIDKTGAIVIPFIYEHCYDFRNGRAVVTTKEWEHKYIDKTGKVVNEQIPPERQIPTAYPGHFEVNGKRGMVNNSGDTIAKAIYQAIGNFHNNRNIVEVNNKGE